jgi:WD40 repeat protein
VQGDLVELLEHDVITSSFLEENALIYGTSHGYISVFTLAGRLIKKYKGHEGKVNAISVDNNGSIILSCSENGTVTSCSMKSDGDDKEIILTSQSSLTAICVEDSLSTKKEHSFVVGMILLLLLSE